MKVARQPSACANAPIIHKLDGLLAIQCLPPINGPIMGPTNTGTINKPIADPLDSIENASATALCPAATSAEMKAPCIPRNTTSKAISSAIQVRFEPEKREGTYLR